MSMDFNVWSVLDRPGTTSILLLCKEVEGEVEHRERISELYPTQPPLAKGEEWNREESGNLGHHLASSPLRFLSDGKIPKPMEGFEETASKNFGRSHRLLLKSDRAQSIAGSATTIFDSKKRTA
jgi:hypothetical protein